VARSLFEIIQELISLQILILSREADPNPTALPEATWDFLSSKLNCGSSDVPSWKATYFWKIVVEYAKVFDMPPAVETQMLGAFLHIDSSHVPLPELFSLIYQAGKRKGDFLSREHNKWAKYILMAVCEYGFIQNCNVDLREASLKVFEMILGMKSELWETVSFNKLIPCILVWMKEACVHLNKEDAPLRYLISLLALVGRLMMRDDKEMKAHHRSLCLQLCQFLKFYAQNVFYCYQVDQWPNIFQLQPSFDDNIMDSKHVKVIGYALDVIVRCSQVKQYLVWLTESNVGQTLLQLHDALFWKQDLLSFNDQGENTSPNIYIHITHFDLLIKLLRLLLLISQEPEFMKRVKFLPPPLLKSFVQKLVHGICLSIKSTRTTSSLPEECIVVDIQDGRPPQEPKDSLQKKSMKLLTRLYVILACYNFHKFVIAWESPSLIV
jgi:hypothetical protein